MSGQQEDAEPEASEIQPQPEKMLAQIGEWLLPTDYKGKDSQLSKHLNVHVLGTSEWLFKSDLYKQWKSSSSDKGFLLISGLPGSGKSVTAAKIVQRLQNEENSDVPVLYFFFRRIIDANQSLDSALRDWLHQLFPYSPLLQQIFAKYQNQYQLLECVSRQDLWQHLRNGLNSMDKCYIIADALDEMNTGDELNEFLNNLIDMGQWKPAEIKILVTSRPVHRVQNPLKLSEVLELRLKDDDVDSDIIIYVQHRLEASDIPKQDYDAIKAAVPGRANGVFLYAKLAMDALTATANSGSSNVNDVLAKLPIDLNQIYNDLLHENAKRTGVSALIQTLILQLATRATRPLRLLEVAQCLSTLKQESIGGQDKSLSEIKSLVRSSCGALLEILPTEVVSVVHHTFTEFLTGVTRTLTKDQINYPILDKGQSEMTLALTCLNYLKAFGLSELTLEKQVKSFNSRAIATGVDQTALTALLDTLLVGEDLEKLFMISSLQSNGEKGDVTILYAVIVWGLLDYAKFLLLRYPDIDINRKGEMHDGPFIYACEKGYTEIVHLLLQRGFDANEVDGGHFSGKSGLYYATINNHFETITLLLYAGANPLLSPTDRDGSRSTGVYSESPLELACQHGHVEALKAMLPFIHESYPLSGAAWKAMNWGRVDIINVLASRPLFDTNGTRSESGLLVAASSFRNKSMIKCLLAAAGGTNVNTKVYGDNQTPLHYWAAKKSQDFKYSDSKRLLPEEDVEASFQLLIGAGADIHTRDIMGNTPLHCVYDIAAAKLLLDAGAQVDAVNNSGEGIARESIIGRDPYLYRFLVDTMANPKYSSTTTIRKESKRIGNDSASNNDSDNNSDPDSNQCNDIDDQDISPDLSPIKETYQSKQQLHPFLESFNNGNINASLNFVIARVGLDAVDNNGNGPLHYAVDLGHNRYLGNKDLRGKLITDLVNAGVDVNHRNRKGETAMHVLGPNAGDIKEPHAPELTILEALIAAGADLDARDNKGQTPLFHYVKKSDSSSNYMTLIKKLKEASPSLQALDYSGRNLLFTSMSAAADRILELVDWLLENGRLDAGHIDHQGSTLYHARAYLGIPDDVLKRLVARGLDLYQTNHQGRTALHYSSAINPYEREDRSPSDIYRRIGDDTPLPAFEGILNKFQQDKTLINAQDHSGITALHLGVTYSEYVVRRLLDAGADPLIPTNEGMTAFHLAARGRQPSVLLVLITHLKKKKQTKLKEALNVPDYADKTPLYYACASGTIESVKLLMEFGAQFTTTISALNACVDFEKEDSYWPKADVQGRASYWGDDQGGWIHGAGSTSLHDTHRTHVGYEYEGNGYPTARLDEIMALMERHKPEERDVDYAIRRAANNGYDYTVNLLLQMRTRLGFEADYAHILASLTCLNRRASLKQSYYEYNLKSTTLSFDYFMAQREYNLAKQIATEAVCLQRNDKGDTIIHELARKGFAALLSNILSPSILKKIDTASLDDSNQGNKQTLLIAACQSPQPNMDVIHVLVEKLGADVNLQRSEDYSSQVETTSGTPLHVLARGVYSWQAQLAIPYLVQHGGADIEALDAAGATPLHEALYNHIKNPIRSIRSFETLAELGANVNATDKDGKSCMTIAIQDSELVNYLISKGATF